VIIVAYVTLVMLHRADGETVSVNPERIVAVTPAHDHGHFAKGVHCVVHTSDHKFLTVRETCAAVHAALKKGGLKKGG
jgi:hypothetical protein